MRAVGYIRVSTEEQANEGHSLDAQQDAIAAFCQARGWTVVEILVDAGLSGASTSRPALQGLLKQAAQGRFDVVVVHAIDRFYRDLQGLLSAFKQLQELGVSFISITENLDFTTPWGKLTLAVLGTLAEIYLDKLRIETSKGKKARARKGLPNGLPPLGYCRGNCAACTDPNGEGYCPRFGQPSLSPAGPADPWVAHPVEQAAVQLAFSRYATGEYSDGQIADLLSEHIHVDEDVDMATSGLLAELSGNELKVLMTLGLEARVLGGDEVAERHFARLKALGVVTDRDRGRLFCYLDRDTIAERTGLSTRTVSTAGNALAGKELIEKRSVRNRSGRHDYNVYFIRPASHLGKFDFNRRPSADDGEAEVHRGKNLPTVEAMGKEPPAVGFPHVKKGSSRGGGEKDLDIEVFARFAERQGVERYEPTDRDTKGLAKVRIEGYSQDQILSAIDEAFDSRDSGAEPIRRFTYCLPIIRSWEPAHQQSQPVPSGSLVATPLVEKTPASTETPSPCNEALPLDPRPVLNGSLAVTLPPGGLKTPVEVLSPSGESLSPEPQPVPSRLPVVTPLVEERPAATGNNGWDLAMERVYEQVQKTGWPTSSTLQTALMAKAVRVDEVARQQGADGPGWVGEAMLVALGRKMGKNGRQAPTDEELLAYADGILANWMHKGKPRARERAKPAPASSQWAVPEGEEYVPIAPESHLLVREPKSEEEELWERVLGDLQLQMTRATFDQWLRGSKVLKFHHEDDAAQLVVGVGGSYAVDWLEHRLKPVIQRTVERLVGQEVTLSFQALNSSRLAEQSPG